MLVEMNRRPWEYLVAAAAAAAALVAGAPAGASTGTPAALASMPLPASALGTQVAGLPLAADSGVVTNSKAAGNASGHVTGAQLAKLGRLTGYQLDFGGMPRSARLSEVQTGVEEYTSSGAAVHGLAFWKQDDLKVDEAKTLGAKVSIARFDASGLGSGSFGDAGTIVLKGMPTIAGADVGFRFGRYLGSVTVEGRSVDDVRALAVRDARALRARMRDVLAGRVTGSATPLPKAGRPRGGPDLAALALGPKDFTIAHVTSQGYKLDSDLNPVAEYERKMSPAGTIASLQESVALFGDVTQARSALTVLRLGLTNKAAMKAAMGSTFSYSSHAVAVQAGDDAFGVLGVAHAHNGASIYLGYVLVRVGRTVELVVIGSPMSIPVTNSSLGLLGRVVADRVSQGLGQKPVA